ncbi:unnamed protein product, partial [Ectocarpus sp. 12 AP-2014]
VLRRWESEHPPKAGSEQQSIWYVDLSLLCVVEPAVDEGGCSFDKFKTADPRPPPLAFVSTDGFNARPIRRSRLVASMNAELFARSSNGVYCCSTRWRQAVWRNLHPALATLP